MRSRLAVPATASLISRDRLLAKVARARAFPLTFLSAPAGYGKTCLMAQWAEELRAHGESVSWVTLDPADNNLEGIVTCLTEALRQYDETAAAPPANLLGRASASSVNAIATHFVNVIDSLEREIWLFLDDVENLSAEPVLGLLSGLATYQPRNLRLILSGRRNPGLPFAELKGRGRLWEITREDLNFLPEEIAAFFRANNLDDLAGPDIEALSRLTEGWGAALRLVLLSLREKKADQRQAFIHSLSGRTEAITNFLAEAVFRKLPASQQKFLIETSILDRFCPALCEAVTGNTDSQKCLDELLAANLFVHGLDEEGQWYRYHVLFREFLGGKAAQDKGFDSLAAHRRAALWFSDAGIFAAALDHAFAAGDTVLGARLLDQWADVIITGRGMENIDTYFARIPDEDLRAYPKARLVQAWALMLRWQFDPARRILSETENRLAASRTGRKDDAAVALADRALHTRLMLAVFSDDVDTMWRLGQAYLAREPRDPYLKGTAQAALIQAEREQYEFSQIDTRALIAQECFDASARREIGHGFLAAIYGASKAVQGDLDEAAALYEEGLALLLRQRPADSPVAAVIGPLLADISYERDDLTEARRLLDLYLPVVGELGFVDQLVAGYRCAAAISFRDKGLKAGLSVLTKGEAIAQSKGFRRLSEALLEERLRQLLECREFARARHLADRTGLTGRPEAFHPGAPASIADQIRMMAWTRLMIADGRPDVALRALQKWTRLIESRGAFRLLVPLRLLEARAELSRGETTAARRAFRAALKHGLFAGLVRTFLDEGQGIRALLVDYAEGLAADNEAMQAYARRLLAGLDRESKSNPPALTVAAIEEDGSTPSLETLKNREFEILQLVGSGLSNRMISGSLGLTENTVKWYLKKVFAKLHVQSRSEAVMRARQHGLIR
ncbi:MAG: LuxR C-terminal-related transcriptional regulator [Alphaproteobacteria bacterium]